MDFFLFILVNAALFIRPGELIPAMLGWPIYNYIILLNLLVAAPGIAHELSEKTLSISPVTKCVLGVFGFIVLSLLARFDIANAWYYGFDFAKVIAYFLLLMATVNTPRRLLTLLGAIATFTFVVNVFAVLNYHGIIEISALDLTPDAGVIRMGATGIFGDPNDLSMIIVTSLMICAGGLFYKRLGPARMLLVGPIGFLGYALTLTHSRGGLLALLAGCGAFLYARFGLARAGLLGAAVFPLLLAGFSGRQSNISGAINSGTGRSRVELWSDGLEAFKGSPLLGVGARHYVDVAGGHVAHNSFVETFTELGFFGGVMFLGAFGIVGWSLWTLCGIRQQIADPGLRHFLPYMVGLLAAYGVSMMALSRQYEVPTYLIAGCGAAFGRFAIPGTSLRTSRLDGRTLAWLSMASIGFLFSAHLYVKFLLR